MEVAKRGATVGFPFPENVKSEKTFRKIAIAPTTRGRLVPACGFRQSAEEGRDEINTQLREVRKTRIRLFALTAILVVVSASLISPHSVSATETNYQNPVTASPPLARPTTTSCAVT